MDFHVVVRIMAALVITCYYVGAQNADPRVIKYVSAEHKLRKERLFGEEYDVDLAPAPSINHTIRVNFSLKITDIHVDEVDGTFSVNTYLSMKWNDFRLRWNVSDNGGVEKIRVRASSIWTPDITLLNSLKVDTMYSQDVKAIVYSDGNIIWVPPEVLLVRCDLNIQRFPYDEHTCYLKFGSWVHDGFVVDIQLENKLEPDSVDYAMIFAYFRDSVWQPINASATRVVHYYSCCPESYPSVTYTIQFRRRPNVYYRVFVGPGIVMAVLASTVFLMPHKSGDRTFLGVGVLICLTIMVLWVALIFPGSLEQVPLILVYYTTIMIMTLLSIMLSAYTSSMRSNTTVPSDMLRRIFINKLSLFFCVSHHYTSYKANDDRQLDLFTTGDHVITGPHTPAIDKHWHCQWQTIATVMDRMLFMIHLVVTVGVILGVLSF